MADDLDYEALLEAPLKQEEKHEEKHTEQNGNAGQELAAQPTAVEDKKRYRLRTGFR